MTSLSPPTLEVFIDEGMDFCEDCENCTLFFDAISGYHKCLICGDALLPYNVKRDIDSDLHIVELSKESERILKEIEKNKPKKLYWYYLVWTFNEDNSIEKIYDNMCKLYDRCKKLGIYYMDISLEETDIKTGKKIRPHYNMRLKSYKMLKKHRDLKNYLKYGNIHFESINKFAVRNDVKLEDAWNGVGDYVNKENSIEVWVDDTL